MELIPETTFVACQSLATLSVALNGAYFTFRLANQPGLHRIEGEFQEAVALSETTPLKDDHVVRNEFRNINARHQNFLQQYYTLYSTIDRYMIWIGYAIALTSVALLVILTLRPDHHISHKRVLIIFFLLYLPVSLCVIAELFTNIWRSKHSGSINGFIKRCQEHIRELGTHTATRMDVQERGKP